MSGASWRRALFHSAFILSALLAAAGWFWAWLALRGIETPLIIHFSDYTGINQIGGMAEVHGLGATGILLSGLNYALARVLAPRSLQWARLLAAATLFMTALLFTAFAAIISVNK